ncbi:M126 protein, partial [Orthonyx spaldingii]|nr:M126 protein [Orthonyx spaldingii]
LNKDKQVSFEEFTIVLTKLADDAHRISHGSDRCGPDKDTSQTRLSELEKSIDVIIDVFHHYSRREGDKDTLTKRELKLLITEQLANYLQHVKNKQTIDEIMKDLDTNQDAQLSFEETMVLVTRVTCATHEDLHKEHHHQHQHQHQHQH